MFNIMNALFAGLTLSPFEGTDNDKEFHTTNPDPEVPTPNPVPKTASGEVITSLRNRYHFPSASNLPHEICFDPHYFDNNARAGVRRKKHWAYLGEIVAMDKMIRLQLIIKDMGGNQLSVFFHLEHGGPSRGPLFHIGGFHPDLRVHETGRAVEAGVEFRVGWTLVLVYPELHNFSDGKCGIRINGTERNYFKALPYSLSELLMANDTIVAQKLSDYKPECFHCKKEVPDKNNLCSKCKVAYYCSKECQTADWQAKPKEGNSTADPKRSGHKFLCKLYNEVKWFTDKDWDKYVFRQEIKFRG